MHNTRWLRLATEKLKKADITTARLDALALLEFCTQLPKSHLLAQPKMPLNKNLVQRLNKLVQKRIEHIPLAYLTGHKEFFGMNFIVNTHTLIPRPETEDMVDLALHLLRRGLSSTQKVLDMGTGSGCVAIAVAKNGPVGLSVSAADVSAKALEVARQNAKNHGADVHFVKSNLFSALQGSSLRGYDVITANLPYVAEVAITSPETAYEPKLALYSGNDGLDIYRQFFAEVRNHLNNRGQVIIEAEEQQHPKLRNIAAVKGFKQIEIRGLALHFRAD